jgi:hypothetical protein
MIRFINMQIFVFGLPSPLKTEIPCPGRSWHVKEIMIFVFFSTYSESVKNLKYGKGTGPIHYNYIHCRGTEDSISNCRTMMKSHCSHYEDLGVKCGEGTAFLLL